ncbi:hypothetical protein NDU88_000957 [Pleurodeles waltl]|uniref:Uncharacterized protein n=1 Tax=Pleurodeles waltl TaxID=8319 RepID=A0AAV7LB70_PLEWA|nr:hypothetical protein NDU88_000957 [Pleurodeles waltl]
MRPLVTDPVTPGRKGKGGEALGGASSASGHLLLLFRAVMLVGSVLPLRQRSIDREGGRGQAASRPVAGSGSRR